jgi:hypothetical protein
MNKPTVLEMLSMMERPPMLQQRPAPPEVSALYTDAQLYKLVVAQALTYGMASTKAEFDEMVRNSGNLPGANELIAFRTLRPGCKAWRHGKSMICDCGAHWRADDANPPKCMVMP